MSTNNIVFENDLFLIADKAHGTPTVPLKNQDMEGTLLGFVAKVCPRVLDVHGKNPWEYGAVHRLDTETSGYVLFAKTQQFYDHIQAEQLKYTFIKQYIACCDEQSPIDDAIIRTYFRSYGPGRKRVKPEEDAKKADSDVVYLTHIRRIEKGKYFCEIARGFRHQIRSVLAYYKCPIVGDKLYNPNPGNEEMQLTCVGMSFPMPDGSIFEYNPQ